MVGDAEESCSELECSLVSLVKECPLLEPSMALCQCKSDSSIQRCNQSRTAGRESEEEVTEFVARDSGQKQWLPISFAFFSTRLSYTKAGFVKATFDVRL
jgi:hypothetical protein